MSRASTIDHLRHARPVVLPSMLMCDFGHLATEIERLDAGGSDGLHMDVMDGEFVPNISYGMPVVAAAKAATKRPIDVHLMIKRPAKYLSEFISAGADLITFHAEAVDDPLPLLQEIQRQDVAAGIAINPQTPLDSIATSIEHCDLILLMSVNAGFGGQSFQEIVLEKIQQLRQRAGESLLIEVDGGINRQTIGRCAAAGADLFVVGSAIFNQSDYQTEISQLKALAGPNEVKPESL